MTVKKLCNLDVKRSILGERFVSVRNTFNKTIFSGDISDMPSNIANMVVKEVMSFMFDDNDGMYMVADFQDPYTGEIDNPEESDIKVEELLDTLYPEEKFIPLAIIVDKNKIFVGNGVQNVPSFIRNMKILSVDASCGRNLIYAKPSYDYAV